MHPNASNTSVKLLEFRIMIKTKKDIYEDIVLNDPVRKYYNWLVERQYAAVCLEHLNLIWPSTYNPPYGITLLKE